MKNGEKLMFDFNLFPVLQTENLVLREPAESDAEALFPMASNEELTRYVEWDRHTSPEDTGAVIESFVRDYGARSGIVWCVQQREGGETVGMIGLTKLDYKNNSAEVGYWIGADFWGMGYASEALEKVLSFGLHALGLERIEAKCVAENPASGRVMHKAGMVFEGTRRRGDFIKGRFWDLRIYSALSNEIKAPGVIMISYSGQLFEAARSIRTTVFVEEQSCPYDEEFDGRDSSVEHALAYVCGRPVGCARFFVEDGHGVIGRLAVLSEFRGKGVGAALCRELIGLARTRGVSSIVIHAQTQAMEFYKKLGFVEYGEKFIESGVEHIHMRLEL